MTYPIRTQETKSVTIEIKCQDIYDLFQAIYEQASPKVIGVYIDVPNYRAILTLESEE